MARLRCHSCGRDGKASGQDERLLNAFAAQPMAPALCPMGAVASAVPNAVPRVGASGLTDEASDAAWLGEEAAAAPLLLELAAAEPAG